ncbi:hypothetical protein PQG02_31940 (plasmid) [Nostoc sp. UHCC 0926]|nr:hypothetical protein [Nostoc sp. UHCC 0926]WDD36017.1 hypothetical protein PQG02_31940 [Nostoc sp. UHCC 0926]
MVDVYTGFKRLGFPLRMGAIACDGLRLPGVSSLELGRSLQIAR